MNKQLAEMHTRIIKFLAGLFPMLPTEAELRKNFPHRPRCTVDRSFDEPQLIKDTDLHIFDDRNTVMCNLFEVSVQESIQFGGSWMSPIPVTVPHLKCNCCGAQAQFRQSPKES